MWHLKQLDIERNVYNCVHTPLCIYRYMPSSWVKLTVEIDLLFHVIWPAFRLIIYAKLYSMGKWKVTLTTESVLMTRVFLLLNRKLGIIDKVMIFFWFCKYTNWDDFYETQILYGIKKSLTKNAVRETLLIRSIKLIISI